MCCVVDSLTELTRFFEQVRAPLLPPKIHSSTSSTALARDLARKYGDRAYANVAKKLLRENPNVPLEGGVSKLDRYIEGISAVYSPKRLN